MGSRSTRRAVARRLAATVIALGCALHTGAVQREAAELRARWESSAQVVVARHDLDIGDRISGADLEMQDRPAALVPRRALTRLPGDPLHATARTARGEPVLEERVDDGTTAASLVPAGRAAVALDVAGHMPAVSAGDRVDLLTASTGSDHLLETDLIRDPSPGATKRVARSAVVLDVDDDPPSLTVAVTEAEVGDTAAATLSGPLAVVLRPSG